MSFGRKLTYSLILLILVLLFMELSAQITFHTKYDFWYQPQKLSRLATQTRYLRKEDGSDYVDTTLAIHPYLGFAQTSSDGDGSIIQPAMGFNENVSPVDSRDIKDHLRVLVLGGSVAVQTMQIVGDERHLDKALEQAFLDAGIEKKLWVYNAALPGFKQPQQLNAYTFILAQGGEFDLVINLDGFNEMTLSIFEGRPKGLHPVYPRGWSTRIGQRASLEDLKKMGRVLEYRDVQERLLRDATKKLWRSAYGGLYLAYRISDLEHKSRQLLEVLEQRDLGKLSFEEGGIKFPGNSDSDLHQYLANLWSRSSMLMSNLATSNGAQYLNVFQPNQYIEDSKPLTQVELDNFYLPDIGHGSAVKVTYPYFREQMDELRNAGVWFSDASHLFKNENQTLYVDTCCHVNDLGVTILSNFIADEVVKKLDHE